MDEKKIYKILVVDDEPTILKAICRILKGDPYEMVTFNDPEKALQFLEANDVDMVIADFHMGKISGFDVFRRLDELNKKPIKILITGTPDASLTPERFKPFGLCGLIVKPWDEDVFRRTVKKALGL